MNLHIGGWSERMMRLSRDEIVKQFQDCARKLDRTPGREAFCRESGVKQWEVEHYWAKFSDLVREAGFAPQGWTQAIHEDDLFKAYARVCAHLGRIPTSPELRIALRELSLPSHNVYTNRYGSVADMKRQFREWLDSGPDDLKPILELPGWETSGTTRPTRSTEVTTATVERTDHPFLPTALQYLDRLSRGEKPFDGFGENVNTAFERRCADAFTCLGFEVERLGQGRGRQADCLAWAREERFGIIIDAKVRADGYVLGTEDRKFREYVETHSHGMLRSGLRHVYLVVVGSEFRESDLKKLTTYLATSAIRSVDFIMAKALMRIVEESIRERHKFRLAQVDELLFGNKIISE